MPSSPARRRHGSSGVRPIGASAGIAGAGGGAAHAPADAPRKRIGPSRDAVNHRVVVVMVEASVALDARVAAGIRARRRARRSYAETPLRSEILRRHHDGAPHVRRRAGIPAAAFLRLPEVAAHPVRAPLELHLHGAIERVEVDDANQARADVPRVLAPVLVVPLDVRVWLVVGAEELDVLLRVSVPDRLVREESERLMIPDGPRDL